jgi:hypothetical protein
MKNKFALLGIVLILGLLVMAATRRPFYTDSTTTQILSGTVVSTADGTVTNTFTSAFSTAPNVISTQVGINTTITNTIVITTTNFVLTVNKATVTNRWIAIGAP